MKWSVIEYLFIVLAFYPSYLLATGPPCKTTLVNSKYYSEFVPGPPIIKAKNKSTAGFIGYLSELLELRIIGTSELERLLLGKEFGEIYNPFYIDEHNYFPAYAANLQSRAKIHYEGFQKYIELNDLDEKIIFNWVKNKLRFKKKQIKRRKVIEQKTVRTYRKQLLVAIPSGTFNMGKGEEKVTVTISQPFMMSSTHVTEAQWVYFMREHSFEYSETEGEEEGLEIYMIDGYPIRMKQDYPGTNVSWWSVLEYMNRRSIAEGLKPVYNMDHLNFIGRAEDGTLDAVYELWEVEDNLPKINAPNGDINLTEGYRMLSDAEWEYVARNLGMADGKYYFGNDDAMLDEYAWTTANSHNESHEVGLLKPIVIAKLPIYDMLGNVREWVYDWHNPTLTGGKDPTGPNNGYHRVQRGGSSWFVDKFKISSYERHGHVYPGSRSTMIGFRMARNILK